MGKISYDQKLNCNHNKGQINMFMDDTKKNQDASNNRRNKTEARRKVTQPYYTRSQKTRICLQQD